MASFAGLTGTKPPQDRKLDSYDLTPALLGTGNSPRTQMFYWTNAELHAARLGPWKLHVKQRDPVNYGREVTLDKPELYNVEQDVSEAYNIADLHPEVIARLLALMKDHQADVEPHEDMLAIPLKK